MSLRFSGKAWPGCVLGGRRIRQIQSEYRRSTLSSGSNCVNALVVIWSARFNRRHETISARADGFDEAGVLGAVIESTTHLGDDRVQAIIEVNKDVRGPKLGA